LLTVPNGGEIPAVRPPAADFAPRPPATGAASAPDVGLARIIEAIGLGQIVPFYQPLVSLVSGEVVGLEALARWSPPGAGAILPEHFVPRLERAGRVSDLTAWMLERACADLASWQDALVLPAHFVVFVNVSATEFADRRLLQLVTEAIWETGVAPPGLCLEITETAQISHLGVAVEVMHELRRLGVRLALDDLGAGFSSLDLLARLPVDLVKIERSVTATVATCAPNRSLVEQVIGEAVGRGLGVVAEGVETAAQARDLVALGCRTGQGFGLGGPEPADEVVRRCFPARPAMAT
jgi:EAL domain-containing protein (putative c-di-GMP-specific phosphodiesterase class I)